MGRAQAAFLQDHREDRVGDGKEAWFQSHLAGSDGPLKVFIKRGKGLIRVLLKGLVMQRDRISGEWGEWNPGGLGRDPGRG